MLQTWVGHIFCKVDIESLSCWAAAIFVSVETYYVPSSIILSGPGFPAKEASDRQQVTAVLPILLLIRVTCVSLRTLLLSGVMARTSQSSFNPPSPQSSSAGAESFKGTPDTRLTVSSPPAVSTSWPRHAKHNGLNSSGASPVHFCVGVADNSRLLSDKDPFVTTVQRASATFQLSPTASSFHPYPMPSGSTTSCYGVNSPMGDITATDRAQTCCLILSSPDGHLPPIDAVAFLLVSPTHPKQSPNSMPCTFLCI